VLAAGKMQLLVVIAAIATDYRHLVSALDQSAREIGELLSRRHDVRPKALVE